MIIKQVTVDELTSAPEFPALLDAYGRESANRELVPPQAKLEMYRAYETIGILAVFAAEQAGALVGFITVVTTVNPHYSVPISVSESFFVDERHRKGGTWRKLLDAAEQRARILGAPGLYVAAPVESPLALALPITGYRETNAVFFKRLYDA